jgi:hypothetical protein
MNKQIDIITDLLIDFDEMGFCPTTLCPDPDAYAIEWRNKMTNALNGYRTELARKIFIDLYSELVLLMDYKGKSAIATAIFKAIEKVDRKYTESEGADDV